MHWIFVTGGVVSGLGKGLTTASLGLLLQDAGWSVNFLKVDPYLNCDAGTLSPHQHGEVYVLADGTECDLDLGHYERFTDLELTGNSSMTTGSVYRSVIEQERRGCYLGQTVQVVPHVTDEIMQRFETVSDDDNADCALIEIGGTVGDIESQPYLFAVRQFMGNWPGRTALLHLALVPQICSGEIKTKPAQHSVAELNRCGLWPDALLCRTDNGIGLTAAAASKLKAVCNATVCEIPTVSNCYEIPRCLLDGKIPDMLARKFGMKMNQSNGQFSKLASLIRARRSKTVEIGMIGKYLAGTDPYRSVEEAIRHASWHVGVDVNLTAIDPDFPDLHGTLDRLDGLLVPGGFGSRGTENMIGWLTAAREKKLPTLGLCLGMQMMVIEYARNVCNLKEATSEEFDGATAGAIIKILPGLRGGQGGAELRRGAKLVTLDGVGEKLYGAKQTTERFRHRYGFDPAKQPGRLTNRICGWSEGIPSLFAASGEAFYVGTQFHPEFLSRPTKPHPLFSALLQVASGISPNGAAS